jgi:hypothetical protein
MPSFPETTAQQGEPSHHSDPRVTKEQQHKTAEASDTHREKQQCDVEGYQADETKEAPAMKLEPQKLQDEAAPAAAFFCDYEGDAQTEEPLRRDTDSLYTAQMRTPTKGSSAELSAVEDGHESESAQTQAVDEHSPSQSEVAVADLPDTAEMDVQSVAEATRDSSTDEAPKSRRWAIPSETRVGGAETDLRYTARKPRRRGSFRLF